MPVRIMHWCNVVFLAGASVAVLSACEKLSESTWFPKVLGLGGKVMYKIQRLVRSRKAMAQEFTVADLSPQFCSNGTAMPNNPVYLTLAADGFRDFHLEVGGLVELPMAFSLTDLRKFPRRTQITRHDCVEGWSAIGKWKGIRLGALLEPVNRSRDNTGNGPQGFQKVGTGKQWFEYVDLS